MAATLNKQVKVNVEIPSTDADGVLASSIISKLKDENGLALANDVYHNYYWRCVGPDGYDARGNAIYLTTKNDSSVLYLTNQYSLHYYWRVLEKEGTHEITKIIWDTSSRYHYDTVTTAPSYIGSDPIFTADRTMKLPVHYCADRSSSDTLNADPSEDPDNMIISQTGSFTGTGYGYEARFYWDNSTPGYIWLKRGISGLTFILSWYQDFMNSSNYENIVVYGYDGTTALPSGVTITPTLYKATWATLEPLSESDRATYKLSYPRDAGVNKKYTDDNRTIVVNVAFTE